MTKARENLIKYIEEKTKLLNEQKGMVIGDQQHNLAAILSACEIIEFIDDREDTRPPSVEE